MTPFWREPDSPEPHSARQRREAAAAIRKAVAAMEHERPDIAERLRALAEELEAEANER